MNKPLLTIFFAFVPFFVWSQTYNMPGGTINTCSGNFYDPGGSAGNYANGANVTTTFCSNSSNCIRVTFSAFQLESGFDNLYIYDGPTIGSPLIGVYTGTTSPGTITSTSGCLTFRFTSDGSVVYSGWAATISCVACPVPANDNPCAATPLTVSAACSYVNSTNANATATGGVPAPGCAGYSGGDVWFSAVVPASGEIIFDTQTGVILDGGMAVYSGTCAAMVLVACDDNSSVNGNMPMISLTGQVPGSTLWVRVWESGNNNNGTFSICAYDPPPPLCYSQSTIAFAPDVPGGGWSTVNLADDQYSPAVNIGFSFCYDGTTYTQLLISSNGYVDFKLAGAGGYSPWSISNAIPTATPAEIQNSILGPWQDLYPTGGGTIRYRTLGTAPNRRFVISWNDVPMFSCTALLNTQQIKLFESSNCIEFHTTNKPLCTTWNSGQAIEGLNNWNGTMASVITGRNAPTQWTTTNDARRLAPTCIPCMTAVLCTPPLPVELVNLNVECNNGEATIRWTTSSQTNNAVFTIEKSEDGISYETIGSIAGAGNSNESISYSFVDEDTRSTPAYYRLKQTDYDGASEYFDPVSVQCSGSHISVVPNPNSGTFQIQGVRPHSTVFITDVSGKIIFKLLDVEGVINIDLPHLSSGIYYLHAESGSERIVTKVMIQ